MQVYVSYPDTVSEDEVHLPNEPVHPGPYVDFPVRVLRSFAKVDLDAGESEVVRLTLTRKDLSYWSNKQQNWILPPNGNFTIWVGSSSRNLPLSVNV